MKFTCSVDSLLWGSDKWKAEYYNRMGNCFYFSFYTFQIIRTVYLLLMIVMTFLMLYFDLRLFIFFIQDWKMLMNCLAIAFIFAFSGKQRTEILFRTKAYNLKHMSGSSTAGLLGGDSDGDVEAVKGYSAWKSVILLYELAQTLSIFHTIMFFAFWREQMYQYYRDKDPKENINIIMRIIIMYSINTLPPLFMLFDMIFSKILFRLRHFWVGLLCSLIFLGIQTLGRRVLGHPAFPERVEELQELYHKAGAVAGFVICHAFLWLISQVKVRLTKETSHFEKDKRLERVISKYDKFLKRREAKRRESIHDDKETNLGETADRIPEENHQLEFMREVLYNYLERELKIPKEKI